MKALGVGVKVRVLPIKPINLSPRARNSKDFTGEIGIIVGIKNPAPTMPNNVGYVLDIDPGYIYAAEVLEPIDDDSDHFSMDDWDQVYDPDSDAEHRRLFKTPYDIPRPVKEGEKV